MLFNETSVAAQPSVLATQSVAATTRNNQPPKKSLIARKSHFLFKKKSYIAPTQSRAAPVSQSAASTPIAPVNNVMVKSADRIGTISFYSYNFSELNETLNDFKSAATKGATVQNIEKLQKERDERRAQQEMVKKAKEMEKAIDPGNPNYQFLLMIREYQSNVSWPIL